MEKAQSSATNKNRYRRRKSNNFNKRMSLNRNTRIEFVEGLRLIIKQGYNPKVVTKYAFDFYLKYKISDSILSEVIEDIMIIDAGPEFELTEQELKELIREKLNVSI